MMEVWEENLDHLLFKVNFIACTIHIYFLFLVEQPSIYQVAKLKKIKLLLQIVK